MRFKVVFTEDAEEEFLSIPKDIQRFLKDSLTKKLEIDPLSYGKPLRYSLKGHRSFRVSNYRIIYKIDSKKIIIIIVKGHSNGYLQNRNS